MTVKSLELCHFRNVTEMRFSPCEGLNVILGDNAQGKTNLLEAVWLFTGGRSFRGAKDGEFISFGEERARMRMCFESGGREQTAEINLGGGRKTVLLNDISQESAAKLAGVFCGVVFSPDHLSLVKQGPEKRRRFIDGSLCQAYPKYGKVLENYTRILKQRAVALRDLQRAPSLLDTLEAWDKHLLDYGAYITWMRARYVSKLSEHASAAYEGISSGKECFEVLYRAGPGEKTGGMAREEIRQAMEKAVRDARAEDIRLGMTTAGPHRDDLVLLLNRLDARAYGSQGQQRSCVLALKLAEASLLEESSGEKPAILLDDVMSELDENRREYLLSRLYGSQVMITCCEKTAFAGLRDGKVFSIKKGVIVENPVETVE